MELKEWVDTKIGQDIWKNKYQNDNETFDEFVERVSDGDYFVKKAILDKTFIPAGRILSNRGLGDKKRVTYSNCFVAGTKVKVRHGLKNIEEIEAGEEVLTASGKYYKVNEAMKKSYSGEMYEISGEYLLSNIRCTPNHKFLTNNGWKEAQYLVPNNCSKCLHPDELKASAPYKKLDYIHIDRIVTTEEEDITVYNLSVEEDHTYVANGVIVHNCYVVEQPKDSLESIFKCASDMARTFSVGGGVGIDISLLSPDGAKVNNAAKSTSGATSFCDLYSLVSGLISQENRRGALMISLACDHPDLEEFIELKSVDGRVTKANISVKIYNEFMEAVLNNKPYTLSFYRPETGETISREVDAKKVFTRLAEVNHAQAEPGCLFWDRIENWNLVSEDDTFFYGGVNPCAEEPLPEGGSCLLGAINLAEMYQYEGDHINYALLEKTVRTGVFFLNEVLDEGLDLHPLDYQRKSVNDWRQIGLGIMGWADLLIKCGITYGSKKSIGLANKIGAFISDVAIAASAECTEAFGKYPKYKNSVLESSFFIENTTEDTKRLVREKGLANSQILTIAPTGSISTMIGVSGGLEPIFANSYVRKTVSLHNGDQFYKVYTPIAKKYMEQHEISDEESLPAYFITAPEIEYHDRIDMQSAWQEHIDASISSTVNLAEETTVEDILDLYIYAWQKGLKGITVYRDNCQRSGILKKESKKDKKSNDELSKLKIETVDEEGKQKEAIKVIKELYDVYKKSTTEEQKDIEKTLFGEVIDRKPELKDSEKRGYVIKTNDSLSGKKKKLTTGCGSLYAESYFDPESGALLETFLNKGSQGGCNSWMVFGSRMISYAMRLGGTLDDILDQAKSCPTCPSYASRRASKHDVSKGHCCASAVMIAIKKMYEDNKKELEKKEYVDNVFAKEKAECEVKTVPLKKKSVEKEDNVINEYDNGMSICPKCGKKTYVSSGGCGYCTNEDCCFSGCD